MQWYLFAKAIQLDIDKSHHQPETKWCVPYQEAILQPFCLFMKLLPNMQTITSFHTLILWKLPYKPPFHRKIHQMKRYANKKEDIILIKVCEDGYIWIFMLFLSFVSIKWTLMIKRTHKATRKNLIDFWSVCNWWSFWFFFKNHRINCYWNFITHRPSCSHLKFKPIWWQLVNISSAKSFFPTVVTRYQFSFCHLPCHIRSFYAKLARRFWSWLLVWSFRCQSWPRHLSSQVKPWSCNRFSRSPTLR